MDLQGQSLMQRFSFLLLHKEHEVAISFPELSPAKKFKFISRLLKWRLRLVKGLFHISFLLVLDLNDTKKREETGFISGT